MCSPGFVVVPRCLAVGEMRRIARSLVCPTHRVRSLAPPLGGRVRCYDGHGERVRLGWSGLAGRSRARLSEASCAARQSDRLRLLPKEIGVGEACEDLRRKDPQIGRATAHQAGPGEPRISLLPQRGGGEIVARKETPSCRARMECVSSGSKTADPPAPSVDSSSSPRKIPIPSTT